MTLLSYDEQKTAIIAEHQENLKNFCYYQKSFNFTYLLAKEMLKLNPDFFFCQNQDHLIVVIPTYMTKTQFLEFLDILEETYLSEFKIELNHLKGSNITTRYSNSEMTIKINYIIQTCELKPTGKMIPELKNKCNWEE